MSRDIDSEACALYAAGRSSREIEQQLGISRFTVLERVSASGAAVRPMGRYRLASNDQIEAARVLRSLGWTVEQVARKYGWSIRTAYRNLKRTT